MDPNGDARTPAQQGWYQIAALGVTLGLSIGGGALSGFIVSNCCEIQHLFDDEEHFHEVYYDDPLEEILEIGKTEVEPVEPRKTEQINEED